MHKTLAIRSGIIALGILIALISSFLPLSSATAKNRIDSDNSNVIHFFAGLANDKGQASRIFSYPLYIISQGEQITWENDDTRSHKLEVTKMQNSSSNSADGNLSTNTIFESQNIQPGGNASFTFKDPGSFLVKSTNDPSLTGNIVVADKMTFGVNSNNRNDNSITTDGVVNVALSWYPDIPKKGETTFFEIDFLDKETGKHHDHIDYTFGIFSATGSEVEVNRGLIHSGEGKEFTSFTFLAPGNFTAVVTVHGVNFVPVASEESKFNILVTK